MTDEITPSEKKEKKVDIQVQNSSAEAVYGLGLIGAWVYYIGRATTPQDRLRGFFKAFAWPAILVYEWLKFFQKE